MKIRVAPAVCVLAVALAMPVVVHAQDRVPDRAHDRDDNRDDRGRAGAYAGGFVGPEDVQVLYQPDPQSYQPDGNLDAQDAGKSFAIVCTISDSGHLSNCYAEANDLNDQNFVRVAMDNARLWVVGPMLRDGEPSAGQSFRLVCRFDRLDDREAPRVASNGR